MEPREPRLNNFLDRATPMLRNLDAAIGKNSDLRAARDSIADRLAEAARHAADVIKGVDGPEIVEAERYAERTGAEPAQAEVVRGAAAPAATAAAGPLPRRDHRDAHWTRARVGRMVAAAGREALRPQLPHARVRAMRIGAGSLLAVAILLLWRWGRRR